MNKNSQTERMPTVSFHICKVLISTNKCVVTESRAWGWGQAGGRAKEEVEGMEKDKFIFWVLVIVSSCTHMSKHQIIHFKYEQFVLCQLYLNVTDITSGRHCQQSSHEEESENTCFKSRGLSELGRRTGLSSGG